METTVKAMKRVGEIKTRREHAFWKHRQAVQGSLHVYRLHLVDPFRMAAAREKQRAHRDKKLAKLKAKTTALDDLLQPMEIDGDLKKNAVAHKIKVSTSSRSALVRSEGRSMGMELD